VSFMAALGFLTVLPVGKDGLDNKRLARAVAFFPLVGMVLGLMLVGADWVLRRGLSDLLSSALVVALLVVFTGALHFEGFVDACDGLFGGHSRERRLEIMRQKQVGAYAVAGGVILLLIKVAAITSISGESRVWVLGFFPVLSRWGMALALGIFPYARQQGLGSAFRSAGLISVCIAGATALAAAVLLGGAGILLFGSATVLALLLGYGISLMLGGLTGDTYGAINEVIEACLLVIAAAMVQHWNVVPVWEGGF
jgi:adenosylcobinamide-GDP ribazoletransferase